MTGSARASARGLEIVNKARKKKGWTKTMTLAWWDAALTSQATLRRFWRKQPIRQETFIQICETVGVSNWRDIVDNSAVEESEAQEMPFIDWGEAPDVYGFYGRYSELALLEQWILTEHCRLVALLGMGGIGKTAMAAMLCDGIQENFKYIIWRSLRYAPPIADTLADLLQFLGLDEQSLPESVNARVSQLVEYLRKQPCLLILDDFDSVFPSNESPSDIQRGTGSYLEGYEGYGELLKRVGQTSSQSCLLIISREKPREIASQEGKTLPIRSLQIAGLEETEARKILKEKDLSEAEDWELLIKLYRGNPLALQIVSAIIRDLFNGNVSEFLRQRTIVLGDMSKVLEQQFRRLSSLEKEIMYWLAIERQPVFLSKLSSNILGTIATSTLLEVLTSLGQRSLIEKTTENSQVLFTLQPIVMKYVTNEFIERVCAEIYDKKIELLKSHNLVKHQPQEGSNEFLSRSILTMVKHRLIKVFTNESSIKECLTQLSSTLQEKPLLEIGYAADNILNLLGELNAT